MKGVTPTALADEMGVANSTVSQVISGRSVSARIQARIAAVTGFSEEVLWQTPLTLKINLPDPRSLAHVDAAVRQALQRALEDLSNGWLPLGAGGSRGLGVFSNPDGLGPQWSDAGVWINQESETEAHT